MNFARVPKIRQVVLELKHKAGCDDRRFVVLEMALLQLLTGKTPTPIFAKRPMPELEVRRDQCIGTKLVLHRRDDIQAFLTKMCVFAMGRNDEFSGVEKRFNKGRLSFDVKSLLLFPEAEAHFDVFETIPSIAVTLITNSTKPHIACDPERLPLGDYTWLQREGLSLKQIDKWSRK